MTTLGFRDVKTIVVDRIKKRIWPVGHVLPGEIEFAKELGVARATVNRAMRELADEGIVERKRKAGTRVAKPGDRSIKIRFPIARNEVQPKGAAYTFQIFDLPEELTSDDVLAKFDTAKASEILAMRVLHLGNSRPFQLEDRWINAQAIPTAPDVDFHTIPPGEWLVEQVPFSDVEIAYFAVLATCEHASLLNCREGDALFASERTTRLHGVTVTLARTYCSPGFRLNTLR